MFLTTCEMLCNISLSLTRWMTWRSMSLVQRASRASNSHSSTRRHPGLSRRERSSVSGRTMRNEVLKAATMSTLDRWGGVRKFSRALKTALRDRAEPD